MTLLRELAIYLTLLLVLLFTGSLMLTVSDARHYMQLELNSHAQDTATSLGVAIASAGQGDAGINVAAIDSMIDAVFDRGYYERIRFSDMSGKVLVVSEHTVEMEEVPNWFVRLIDLQSPVVSSEINGGWMPMGTLEVVSHPGYAYRSLWSKTRGDVLLFGSGLLLAIMGLNIFLGIVLRPLRRMEKQANSICQRRFEIQSVLPRTRDLRRVVEAMNRMAGKLEQLFTEKVVLTEELRRKALTDPLTGALNRRAFRDRISSALDEERGEAGGSLLMIQIRGLDELNRTRGHKYVDELLLEVSRQVDKTLSPWEQAFQGRIEGSIFMVFFPACTLDENRQVTELMFRELASMHCFNSTNLASGGDNHLHMASVTHRGRCRTEALFEHVEQLMLSLEVQVNNCWEVADVSGEESHAYMRWSDEQWRKTLEDVFTRRRIELHCQPVFDRQGRQLYKEVFARLKLEGEQVSAEAFLPMVERFGLHAEFDRAVFLTLADHMEHTDEHQTYCLNLAPHSLMDGRFYHWLFSTLRSRPDVSRRLVLETPERTLVLVGDQMAERVRKLVSTGCRFSVDHFGIASQCLASLQAMDFHYIKVDSSFIRDIDENQGNQLYIRTLAMLAGARDIQIFAQGIEHENEWDTLLKLGIHGGQGYYLGRPGHL